MTRYDEYGVEISSLWIYLPKRLIVFLWIDIIIPLYNVALLLAVLILQVTVTVVKVSWVYVMKPTILAMALLWKFVLKPIGIISYIVGLLAVLFFGVTSWYEQRYESCSEVWIRPTLFSLETDLSSIFFGQHLVKNIITRSMRSYRENKKPRKPVAFSFHGSSGSGKTFVSQIIANNFYRKGTKSKYFNFFSALNNFPHADKVAQYQDELRSIVKAKVKECPNSMFVFDEVDKLPPGIFNGIKPFMDYNDQIDGIDFRHVIFIFISNTGGKEIAHVTADFWKHGRKREEITLKDISHVISAEALNIDGGFQDSNIIKSNLVDHFIPFLPMERTHVKLCIEQEFQRRNRPIFSDDEINNIADQLQYFPDDKKLFSTSGCKLVEKLVDVSIED